MTQVRRPTIADVARGAGVSKGAVSYALNGLPGVSEGTRARIMAVARELDWQPHHAARALSVSRAGALGLVIARPASTLGAEMFYMQLLSGIESELARRSTALVLQVVTDPAEELATYRRWAAQHRVDGVFLTDLRVDDPREALLAEIGVPAVVVGGRPRDADPAPGDPTAPRVWSDDTAATESVVRYLHTLGHRDVARVAGRPDFRHTRDRAAAFDATCAALEIAARTVDTDFSGEAGADATRSLLTGRDRPTAIVYDNDLMAVAGSAVAAELGVAVPGAVSLVAWDDSVLCRLVHPPLTAVGRDIAAFGRHAAETLSAVVAGAAVPDRQDPTPLLVPRASTGPPPGR